MSTLRFNTQELVGRFEDRRDVKNLAGKYVMSLLLKKEPTILRDLWSARDDISLGVNGGYYAGRQALEGYYASIDAATKKKAQVLKEVFPEDLGEYSDEKLYGRGPMEIRSLDNAIIEVADDGKSARGSFITPGVIFCRLNRHQYPYCNVLWERYGSDFVLENGKWKYLHEQVCPDIMGKLDMTNFAHDDYERLTAPEEKGIGPVTLGEDPDVTDPGPLHLPYSVIMPPQNTVPWPVPYVTLDNDNSYCPVKTFAELQAEKE